jgi:hypothetical protein
VKYLERLPKGSNNKKTEIGIQVAIGENPGRLTRRKPGLPDGIFSKTKIQIWVNFGGSCNLPKMLVYFMSIWYILRPFGIFYGH